MTCGLEQAAVDHLFGAVQQTQSPLEILRNQIYRQHSSLTEVFRSFDVDCDGYMVKTPPLPGVSTAFVADAACTWRVSRARTSSCSACQATARASPKPWATPANSTCPSATSRRSSRRWTRREPGLSFTVLCLSLSFSLPSTVFHCPSTVLFTAPFTAVHCPFHCPIHRRSLSFHRLSPRFCCSFVDFAGFSEVIDERLPADWDSEIVTEMQKVLYKKG